MGKTLNEANGVFMMGKNLKYNEDDLLLDNLSFKAKQEREANELSTKLIAASKEKQETINKKLKNLEILPMGNKIILSAYPKNPYRKVMEGNIIVDWDGEFNNPDTGEKDKQEVFVGCAEVIEVGPEVKYLKPGDDIYYDTRTVYPVPFMSLGYKLTQENQVLCVLNEKLKERFKM